MELLPLHILFPAVARDAARALLVRFANGGLPVDDYVLVEHCCATPGCDCRRVYLGVVRTSTRAPVATLVYAFGTSPPAFFVDPERPQSELAPEVLAFFQETCGADARYLAGLQDRCFLWRRVVDAPDHPLHGDLQAARTRIANTSPPATRPAPSLKRADGLYGPRRG